MLRLLRTNALWFTVFAEARLNYLRVVVSYKEQQRYVAKAMFFAGRAFDFKGDEESRSRAKLMYRRVVQRFGESPWAGEARKQLGG